MSSGRVSDGAVVSTIVTLNIPVVVASALSVTAQFTCVIPSAKVEPEAGEHVGVSAPSSASVAVTVNETAAPEALVASLVMSAGRLSDGGSFGGVTLLTVNVKSALLNVLPVTPPLIECVMG